MCIYGKVGVLEVNTEKKSKVSAKDQKYAESWVPIKSILNGMIQLEDGYQVTGVKVQPKNIFIMDYESQRNVIYNLRNFYNTIDYEFWIIVADRPVDINVYLSQLQLLYNNVQTPVMKKLVMQDINKANLFMSKEVGVADTEYFLLFKEKRPEIISKRIQSIISNLASCGLQATQTSNDDLRVLIDGFFNDGNKTEFGTVISA